MPRLRDLQAQFRRAVLGGDAAEIAQAIRGDGPAPDALIEVYRGHVQASLAKALETSFPVTCRLVGEDFFAHAAREFIAQSPPQSAYLLEYGAAFPTFLDSFPPAAPLVYLGDVARLEWAIHAVYHAPDAPGLDPATLRARDPGDAPALRFRFRPSIAYVASPWPIERIWRSNQLGGPEEDTTIDLDSGGVRLEVRQQGEGVALRDLPASVFAFRQALANGETLEAAAVAGFGCDPEFDLAAALRTLLADGVLAELASERLGDARR